MNRNNIQTIFEQANGVANTQYLKEKGVSYYHINQLLEAAQIIKIKQGLYKWADFETDELVEVAHIVPKGVLCLFTACNYYELTTFVSSEYHVAIPDEHKIVLPDYPPIKLYYWNTIPYNLGITTVLLNEKPVKIYNIEKTVCDVVRHRNKVGFDIVKEVFKNYLQKKNRNLSQLNIYAKALNIHNIIHEFINILV